MPISDHAAKQNKDKEAYYLVQSGHVLLRARLLANLYNVQRRVNDTLFK